MAEVKEEREAGRGVAQSERNQVSSRDSISRWLCFPPWPQGRVVLRFLEGRFFENASPVEASVKAGEVWSSVQKAMGGGGSFTVKSSHAVAGVRGTRFLTASSKSETSVKVFSGGFLCPISRFTRSRVLKGPAFGLLARKKCQKRNGWNSSPMQFIKVSSGGGMTQPTAFAANSPTNSSSGALRLMLSRALRSEASRRFPF